MNRVLSRKLRRQLGSIVLPSLVLTIGLLSIVASGYWSRSAQANKYALPADHSADSMLKFLRKLDSDYDPGNSLFSESNLPAIHEAVQRATDIFRENTNGLSTAELREADFYRLRFGYLAMMLNGVECKDESKWNAILELTRAYIEESTHVSSKESMIAGYSIKSLDLSGRTEEGIQMALLIEEKFASLPDSKYKSATLHDIEGMRSRLQLLGREIDLVTNTLNGVPLQIKDLRGKVVLVEFITPTCTHCIAEFPALKRIYNTYHDRGFEVLSICLHASAAKITAFTKEHKLPWISVCHDLVEGNEELGSRFSINAYPTTMLFDQTGKLIKFGVRPLAPPQIKDLDLEENIKKLLQ